MGNNNQAQTVYAAYQAGVESSTIAGRESSFNEALYLLQQLQLETGAYYYDVGNVYYQLEQYPWALFYYIKARKELPRDFQVKQNIQATVEKLGLDAPVPSLWIPLSESEEIAIVQVLILATTMLLSLRIWMDYDGLKFVSRGVLAAAVFSFLFVVSHYYFTPEQGVLAKAAILYKKAGTQYERVFLDPLPPGSIVEVIGDAEQGEWTKVVSQDDVIGYIQTDHLLL